MHREAESNFSEVYCSKVRLGEISVRYISFYKLEYSTFLTDLWRNDTLRLKNETEWWQTYIMYV
jgi:hypothetical protein